MSRARDLARLGGSRAFVTGNSHTVGFSTFASNAHFESGVTVDGDLNVTGDLSYDQTTASNQRITGISTLTQTVTQDIVVSAGMTAATAQISDLTAGRVVVAGTNGELEDSGSLTFSGGTLTATTFSGSLPTSDLTGTITNAQLAGSISNDKMAAATVSYGGVTLSLGGSDATPAFNLSDATDYPTSSLDGTITNDQLAGNIANSKLANNHVSFGGVDVNLGASDATPAFDLSDATNYPTSSLSGTITNAQLAGSIANSKLSNSSVSYGGISLSLGGSDATPAFDLSDATNYPTSSLTGTITNDQLDGSIANSKLSNSSVSFGGVSVSLGGADATPAFDLSDATNYPTSSLTGTITNAQLAGSIANSKLANSSATVTAGDALTGGGTLTLGSSVTLDVAVDDSSIEVSGSDAIRVKASGITNEMLAGSISNSKLVGSSVSFGGVSIPLGGSDATPAFNLEDASGLPISSGVDGLGANVATFLGTPSSNNLRAAVTGETGSGALVFGTSPTLATPSISGGTFTGRQELNDASLSGGLTVGAGLTVTGDLVVNGTTTTINSTTISVDDKHIELGATDSPDDSSADGGGIILKGDTDHTLLWHNDNDHWQSSEHFNLASGKTYQIADTGVLSATTLGSGVVNSSLTSVGTINSGVWQGTAIANAYLANSSVSLGGVSVSLGGSDATPAFDLQDATNLPTTSLTGTITNAQLAGSIANNKLSNSSVSLGGVSVSLGGSDATPAFDLSDATDYPTSSLVGTITNAQLAGSIANSKLSNSSVSFGGVSLSLGGSDATPAFNLSDATNYPTSSLSGTITNAQLAGSIANGKLANSSVSYGGVSLSLGGSDSTPAFNLSDATNINASAINAGTIGDAYLPGTISSNITGTAQVATTVALTATNSATGFHYITFSDSTTGNENMRTDTGLRYVPSTGEFNVVNVTASTASLGSIACTGNVTGTWAGTAIANNKLANSSVSYGGVSLSLGGSDATPAFNLSDATGYRTSALSGTITNAQLAGSIANSKLSNSSVSFGGVSLSLGGSDSTPAFNLVHATGLPISSGVSGLASGAATFLATPSSANLRSLVTNETGSGSLVFGTNPTIAGMTVSGHVVPNANGTINLGASGTRFANVFSSDLDLSNEAKGVNTVDGTWGSYLIEEGEEHLYITNRRSGKKFRFMLEEV